MKTPAIALAAALVTLATLGACQDPEGTFADAGQLDADTADGSGDDTTPPETTITDQPSDPSTTASASFAFTADEPDATFECRLDGDAFSACASPYTTVVTDGAHTFEVRAIDVAGNVDETPAAYTWTTDATPPETTLTGAPPAIDNSVDVTFTFEANEAATFECSLDGAAFAACTSPDARTGLADGAHTFAVRAIDAAGNADASPATHAWTIDSSTPDTQIDSGPTGAVASTTATFTYSSPDTTGATFECALDGAAFATCPSTGVTFAGLAQGAHTFAVRALDAVQNVDPTPATRAWTVDTVPPDTTIDTAPASPTNQTSASLAFSSPDATATFECALDGAAFAACTSPQAYTGLAAGAHTFAVRARDPAGNVDASPDSHTWTIDLTAPDTSITAAPASQTNQTTASFSFTSGDATATFECALDGAAFTACTSPRAYTGLAAGAHTFAVRARDLAGNVDASPAQHAWTIDTTPPDTTITAAPASPTNQTSASFSFTSGDPTATFECSHMGGAFAACTSPQAYSGLGAGAHTFAVRARDPAGNVDASPAQHTWTIDLTAPDTTITAAPANPTNQTTASFSFTSGDATATFECSHMGSAFTACTSPQTYSGLAPGAHSFAVRARDPAGNVDASPAQHAWTIDTTPPGTTMTTSVAEPWPVDYADFSIGGDADAAYFECSLDGGAFTACGTATSVTVTYGVLHTFRARACDSLANCDASPATFSWTANPGLVVYLPVDQTLVNTTTLGAVHDAQAVDAYGPGVLGFAQRDPGGNALVVPRSARPMSTSPDGGYTIAFWERATAAHYPVDFVGGSGCRLYENVDMAELCCTDPSGEETCTGPMPRPPPQGWRHLALVSQPGTGDVHVYIGGAFLGMLTNPGGHEWFTEAAADMMFSRGVAAELDDVRLYNRALGDVEICTLAGGNPSDGCLDAGPAMELHFDDALGNTGHWGLEVFAEVANYTGGVFGSAIRAVQGDFVTAMSFATLVPGTEDFVISFWYLPTGDQAELLDFGCDESFDCTGNSGGIWFNAVGDQLEVCMATDSGFGLCEIGGGGAVGVWHHVAARVRQSAGDGFFVTDSIELFLDGKLARTWNPDGAVFRFAPGQYYVGPGAQPAFVDEVEIWDTDLTDDLVCALAMGSWNGAVCE